MKKRWLWIFCFFVLGCMFVFFMTQPKTNKKWIYKKLPNYYVIEKLSETKIVLGKYKKNSFSQTLEEDYIAEFCYGENYIGLKCLKADENNIEVLFYLIDAKEDKIYGPYQEQETYQEMMKKIVDETLSDWVETIQIPKEATKK